MSSELRHKIARIITLDHLQLLSDFDVDADLYRMDPECADSAYAVADNIIAALPGMVQPLEWIKAGDDRFTHDADYIDTTFTYQIQEGVFWYAAESDGHLCGSNSAAKAAAQAHHVAQAVAPFGIDTPTPAREEVKE